MYGMWPNLVLLSWPIPWQSALPRQRTQSSRSDHTNAGMLPQMPACVVRDVECRAHVFAGLRSFDSRRPAMCAYDASGNTAPRVIISHARTNNLVQTLDYFPYGATRVSAATSTN
jgi:hypothetical protein